MGWTCSRWKTPWIWWLIRRLKWESCPSKSTHLEAPLKLWKATATMSLADMILTAKKGLPLERPLHLFGAGHPSMFALAVALGCDLFDSAAYALYARENRYMTENGTWRLNDLDYFPCSCPRCSMETPRGLEMKVAKGTGSFPCRTQPLRLPSRT